MGACALLSAAPPARALVNLDGERNQIFVFGSVAVGYDSNIFSNSSDLGGYTWDFTVGADLKRRAGIIGVNVTATVNSFRYPSYKQENYLNPNFFIEFIKTNGRMTGSLSLNIYRESRADSTVNTRTNSWNFPIALNLKYPINEKFYTTSISTYLQRRYIEDTALTDYTDFSEALDLFYVYTSKLDLLGGYRYRISETTNGNDATDHWLYLGATGALFAKLTGNVRVGYQVRQASGGDNYDQFSAQAGVSWLLTRKITLAGQVSRDFNTIATGESVDSTSAQLTATYLYSRKYDFTAGVDCGINDFLSATTADRHDTFFSYNLGAHYHMNEHLNAGLTYTYYQNWSTLDYADYHRHLFAIDISSRY